MSFLCKSQIVREASFAAVLVASGCASVDPGPDYDKATQYVAEATGQDSARIPDNKESAERNIGEWLSDGLSAKEAVKITLLNNPRLQADLFEIGVAKADLVQSGLLSNPSLAALIRFPTAGGASNGEVELVQNLIELWQIPVRKRAAERQLQRTILRISHEASLLAAKAKASYYSALASERALAVEEENLGIVRELLDLTLARQQAGAATEVDVNVVRSQLLNQEVTTRVSRLAAFEAKRMLVTLLGLETSPDSLQLSDKLTDLEAPDVSLARLLALAKEHRLDIQAARETVRAAEENARLQRRLFLKKAALGVALETEGSDVALGPAIDVELPIFDQNQAQIAKADFRCQQAQKRLRAINLSSIQETRGAYARFSAARDIAQSYTERLLPLQRQNLELARETFQAGKTSFLAVLEVQQRFIYTRREYIKRLRALALTFPDLESVTGRPLSSILEIPQPTKE